VNYSELSKPLYHGSTSSFSEIDLSQSVPRKDFGRGFYATNDSFQAEKFARLKAKRARIAKGYVVVFRFQNAEGLNIKQFPYSNEEWFDFVLRNRGYGELAAPMSDDAFDIVIGPVANDAVGLILNQYIVGVYGDPETAEAKATAIRLLLTQKLHNQVFFGTERAVSRLSFLEAYDVYVD
jgi:hypothetical protein